MRCMIAGFRLENEETLALAFPYRVCHLLICIWPDGDQMSAGKLIPRQYSHRGRYLRRALQSNIFERPDPCEECRCSSRIAQAGTQSFQKAEGELGSGAAMQGGCLVGGNAVWLRARRVCLPIVSTLGGLFESPLPLVIGRAQGYG